MYKHACKTGLEGVVSKVRDSRYVSGRVNDWVKKTCAQRETLGSFSRSASEPGIAVPQTSSRSSSVSRLLRADGCQPLQIVLNPIGALVFAWGANASALPT
jgi:hypothetical protein